MLRSASRLLPDLTTQDERELITDAVKCLALLDRNRQLVDIGAYEKGTNPDLDRALRVAPALQQWLRQTDGGVERASAMKELRAVLWPDRPSLAPPAMPAAPATGPATPPKRVSFSLTGQGAAAVKGRM